MRFNTIAAMKSTPSFITEIKDQRAFEGDSVTFQCQFAGVPPPGILIY